MQKFKSISNDIICQVGQIVELNKAAFGAKFAFSDMSGKIFYSNKHAYLHELNAIIESREGRYILKITEFELLIWSKDPGGVYFVEYTIEKGEMSYNSVIINSLTRKIIKINENKNKFQKVRELGILDSLFSVSEVERQLLSEGSVATYTNW